MKIFYFEFLVIILIFEFCTFKLVTKKYIKN